jgi:hypothetical protein
MKNLVAILTLTALAGVAAAEIHDTGVITIDLQGNVVNNDFNPAADTEVYDNWRATAQGGVSTLQALYRAGRNEIADLCNMTAGGQLGSCGFNIGNSAATGSGLVLTGGTGTIRFYDGTSGTYINGFNFNLPTLNLAVGSSSRISFADGSLAAFNIILPQSVFMSVQYTNVTGTVSLADVSHQIRNPHNTGSSTDGLIDVTTNTNIAFNGNPVANAGLFIKVVPAPTSAAALAMGGLIAARRRRA